MSIKQPLKPKWRRVHRGRRKGKAKGGDFLNYGDHGLQALEPAWITAREIEACRVAISRCIKRGGRVFIRIFPDKPVSKKPLETRMGKGKPGPEFWVAVIKPGRILFEMEGIPEVLAREAMALAAAKLPLKTKFVKRDLMYAN